MKIIVNHLEGNFYTWRPDCCLLRASKMPVMMGCETEGGLPLSDHPLFQNKWHVVHSESLLIL